MAVSCDVLRPLVMKIRAINKEGVKFAGGQLRHVVSGNTTFNLFVFLGVLNSPNPFSSLGTLVGLVNIYSMV